VLLRRRFAIPVLLAVLSVGRSVHAQEKQSDLERARALFDEAGELERQGHWPAAQDRLRTALRIRETPNLRYALGWALENDEKLIEARTEYEVALRLAQNAGNEEVSKLAASRIAEVDRKTPLVQVRIKGLIARDTRVLVDGREVTIRADAGTVPVDPGSRIVRVERAGRPATEQTVSVARGVLRVVEVKGDDSVTVLDENGATVGAKPAILPWVLVGGGGVLVVSSVILLASSAADAAARDENTKNWCAATACVGGSTATRPETAEAAAFRREAYDAASRGNTKQVASAILGGVGAVGIGVGVYLLLRPSPAERAKTARSSRLHIDASPLTGGGMASAALAF
jgi:tetratricopeptide (TPR) repeat protein